MVMINVNCLDHPPKIEKDAIKHWDGANF
jgi:hypothetical protein